MGDRGGEAAVLMAVLYLSFDYVMAQELFQGIIFRAVLPKI